MNPDLLTAPYRDRIQPTVVFKPSVEPFNTRPAVVDHLPFGGLWGRGPQSLVSRVREDNRPRPVVGAYQVVQLAARPGLTLDTPRETYTILLSMRRMDDAGRPEGT